MGNIPGKDRFWELFLFLVGNFDACTGPKSTFLRFCPNDLNFRQQGTVQINRFCGQDLGELLRDFMSSNDRFERVRCI